MPLRSQKPCYRIQSFADHYEVVAFPTSNGRRIIYRGVRVPKGDPVAFKAIVESLVDETREKFSIQRM